MGDSVIDIKYDLGARNSYCTPRWLTDLLPEVSLDPCSNPRSTVRAKLTYSLESGRDGLSLPWIGSCFVNPPFADIMPWALKGEEATVTALAYLVNVDSSTAWWKRIQAHCQYALLFSKRIQFTPPQGVAVSTNSKPQALLCNRAFKTMCEGRLDEHGTWWQQ